MKCANTTRGTFLGFVNTNNPKPKCAVIWDAPLSRNVNRGTRRRGVDAKNVCKPCKESGDISGDHGVAETCKSAVNEQVESNETNRSSQLCNHSCTTPDNVFCRQHSAHADIETCRPGFDEVESAEAEHRAHADIETCRPGIDEVESAEAEHLCEPCSDRSNNVSGKELLAQAENDYTDRLEKEIKLGDLILDRCQDDFSAKPVWMVVTQTAHRGACCVAENIHRIDKDPEPFRISLTPALFGKRGVTNTPDHTRQTECWEVKLVKDAKSVTNIFLNGFKVICRDNYHECMVSCRKYKGTLRSRYCRMRLPRRPMEKTCFSQLYVPRDDVCNFVSITPNRETLLVARPLKEIEGNSRCDDYWDAHNTDVLCPADERALVLDLSRLSGKRAIGAMSELLREQLVPALMRGFLRALPSTETLTTLTTVFQERPFGFKVSAPSNGDFVTVSEVEPESVAAKAGVMKGMKVIKVQTICVRAQPLKIVQKAIDELPDRDAKITFEEALSPVIQSPGVYHVKHRSMITAALLVSNIESFLGHMHVYNDSRLAETSPIMASFLNCNTNLQLVGSLTSAMAILQYLSGYLSKNPVELCNFLTCIIAGRRRCKLYKSIADDAGTKHRNAKFMAQKVSVIKRK